MHKVQISPAEREWLTDSLNSWKEGLAEVQAETKPDRYQIWKHTQMVALRQIQLQGGEFPDLPDHLRNYKQYVRTYRSDALGAVTIPEDDQ